MPAAEELSEARHVIGLDLGTTNVRTHVMHYSAEGQPSGEPALVHLPGSERDGALPSVLEIDEAGSMRSFGRPALLSMPRGGAGRFVSEFKPCIGQSPDDLRAQGRPEKARFCINPACPHPGWAWSVAMRFCGFCGGQLQSATAGARWQPTFAYSQAQALDYTRQLLTQVAQRLEAQFGEALQSQTGWAVAAGVPVHWQPETLRAYEEVLGQAFPEVAVHLINEPSGALRYYAAREMLTGKVEGTASGWTLVVDFGGGTTDLVLAQVEIAYGYLRIGEVRSYGERYGGIDFDLMLAHHAATELGVALDGGLLTQWKFQARDLKEAFSARVQQARPLGASNGDAPPDEVSATVAFPVPREGGSFDYAPVTLGRSDFSRVTGDLIERFRSVLERGLKQFQVAPDEIRQVVLTGGGAHWFFVQDTVREMLPDARMLAGVEPEKSISQGLALSAARMRQAPAAAQAPPPRVPQEVKQQGIKQEVKAEPSPVMDDASIPSPPSAPLSATTVLPIPTEIAAAPAAEPRQLPAPDEDRIPHDGRRMPLSINTVAPGSAGAFGSPRSKAALGAAAVVAILIVAVALRLLLGHHVAPPPPAGRPVPAVTVPAAAAVNPTTADQEKRKQEKLKQEKLKAAADVLNRKQTDFDRRFQDWQKRAQSVDHRNVAAVNALNAEGAKLTSEQNLLAEQHQRLQEQINQSQRATAAP